MCSLPLLPEPCPELLHFSHFSPPSFWTWLAVGPNMSRERTSRTTCLTHVRVRPPPTSSKKHGFIATYSAIEFFLPFVNLWETMWFQSTLSCCLHIRLNPFASLRILLNHLGFFLVPDLAFAGVSMIFSSKCIAGCLAMSRTAFISSFPSGFFSISCVAARTPPDVKAPLMFPLGHIHSPPACSKALLFLLQVVVHRKTDPNMTGTSSS